MPEPISDFMLDVISGKKTVSLEVLRGWRADFGARLDNWKHNEHMRQAGAELQDAYQARLAEAYRRSVENAAIMLAHLDVKIREAEAALP